jgi:hypothetical protein
MVVRNAQLAALGSYMWVAFVNRMVSHLRGAYPKLTANRNDEELRTEIRSGIQSANSFGIHFDNNLEFFLECATLYGQDFFDRAEYQWARAVLLDARLSETQKMERINEHQLFGGGMGRG